MNDPFGLQRFVAAQDGVYPRVIAELERGRKTGHWMWFVFPQLAGLGSSDMSQRFSISSAAEARAYLSHPILGARLRECTRLVTSIEGRSAEAIFGYPDVLKFRSSMTLFSRVDRDNRPFVEALDLLYGGEADPLTLRLLG